MKDTKSVPWLSRVMDNTVIGPYIELMRLEKPTGTLVTFWPYAWSITMASYAYRIPLTGYIPLIAKAYFGATIVHSAGCTWNDIVDRDIDGLVERTKGRVLPSGRLSLSAAVVTWLAQLVAGLAFFHTFNRLVFALALIWMLPLSMIYPYLKRVTNLPQAWLGIALNFSVPLSWATIGGTLDSSVWMLTLASVWCWTMYYDTIYACQDKRDDAKAGLHSTALLFGSNALNFIIFFASCFISLLAVAGFENGQGPIFFVFSILGGILHLVWQVAMLDLENPRAATLSFIRNGYLGGFVLAGMFLDYVRVLM